MNTNITEVFDAEFRQVFEVPTTSLVHLPPSRLNITRLVLCRNYRAGERDSCAMSANCKFVHADCDYAQLPTHSIHVHYVWRHEDCCIYPRLAAGEALHIYAPHVEVEAHDSATEGHAGALATTATTADGVVEVANEKVDLMVMSECVLRTAGAVACVMAMHRASSPETTEATPASADHVKLRHCADFCWQRICKRGEDCPDAHVLYIDADAKDGQFKRAPARPLPSGVRLAPPMQSRKLHAVAPSAGGGVGAGCGAEFNGGERVDPQQQQQPPHSLDQQVPPMPYAERDRRRFSPLPPPPHPSDVAVGHEASLAYGHNGMAAPQLAHRQHTPPLSVGLPSGGRGKLQQRRDGPGLTLQWPVPSSANEQQQQQQHQPAEANVLTPLQDTLSLGQVHMPTFHQLELSPPEAGLAPRARLAAAAPLTQPFYPPSVGFAGAAYGHPHAMHAAAMARPGAHSYGLNAPAPQPQSMAMPTPGMDAAAREFYPGMIYRPQTGAQQQQQAPGQYPASPHPMAVNGVFQDPVVHHTGRQTHAPSHQNRSESGSAAAAAASAQAGLAVPAPRSSTSSGSGSAAPPPAHRASPKPGPSSSLPSTPLLPNNGGVMSNTANRSESAFATRSPNGPEFSFRTQRLVGQGSVSNTHLSVTPNAAFLASPYGSNMQLNLASSQGYTPPATNLHVTSTGMNTEGDYNNKSKSKSKKAACEREVQAPSSSGVFMGSSACGRDGVPAMVLPVEEPAVMTQAQIGSSSNNNNRSSRVLCGVYVASASAAAHGTTTPRPANETSMVLGASDGALGVSCSRANLSMSNLSTSKSVYRHNPYSQGEPRTVLTQQ